MKVSQAYWVPDFGVAHSLAVSNANTDPGLDTSGTGLGVGDENALFLGCEGSFYPTGNGSSRKSFVQESVMA